MRNRKTKIVAFLLVAVLCLGIGFAALTDTLQVEGTFYWDQDEANKAFDLNVYFKNAEVDADASTDTVDASKIRLDGYALKNGSEAKPTATGEYDKLTVNVDGGALVFLGEKVVINATIANNSTRDARLEVTNESVSNDWLDVDYKIIYPDGRDTVKAKTGTCTLVITIKLIGTPDPADYNAEEGNKFTAKITATSVDPE